MKITYEVELSKEEAEQLLTNSIERVFNTAIELGINVEQTAKSEHMRELGSTSWQDCTELKLLVDKLWSGMRNEVFQYRNNMGRYRK